jgi:hypothetical protein
MVSGGILAVKDKILSPAGAQLDVAFVPKGFDTPPLGAVIRY